MSIFSVISKMVLSGDGVDINDPIQPPDPGPLVFSGDQVNAFGDSITVGFNASVDANSYINLFGAARSATINNYAVSGQGCQTMAKRALQGFITANQYVMTAMTGYNDYRRAGANPKTDKKVQACHRDLMIAQWVNTFYSVSAATLVGSWSDFTYGDQIGHFATDKQSSSNGDTLSWTFTGRNIAVGFIGGDGVSWSYGSVKIYIDDVLQDTVSLSDVTDNEPVGDQDNSRVAYPWLKFGLTDAEHTVKIEVSGDTTVIVDYLALLEAPNLCLPVAVMSIPYAGVDGYTVGAPYNNASDEILDAGTVVIAAVVNEFQTAGYPTAICDTNSFYDRVAGISIDKIHPNDTGMGQLFGGLDSLFD